MTRVETKSHTPKGLSHLGAQRLISLELTLIMSFPFFSIFFFICGQVKYKILTMTFWVLRPLAPVYLSKAHLSLSSSPFSPSHHLGLLVPAFLQEYAFRPWNTCCSFFYLAPLLFSRTQIIFTLNISTLNVTSSERPLLSPSAQVRAPSYKSRRLPEHSLS